MDLCAEYESFSFDPIQTDLLFESIKSELVESDNLGIKNFDLVQILMLLKITRLVDLGPNVLPRSILHDDIISRPMTHQLASLNYICMFDVWAHTFDKLKRALTSAALIRYMYFT